MNSPELIFNNCGYKDLYWEVDAGEKWQLSYKIGPTHDCYVCQKHKYGVVFIDKRGNNEDLEEIKDPAIIEKVKQDLNLEDGADDYTPIICGSVVGGGGYNGGFKRKLKMLRADLFAMLSVC